MKNREYGSDFSLVKDQDFLTIPTRGNKYCNSGYSLFFSGRAALLTLLEFGVKKLNWKKMYVPSYYCHEVVDFLGELSLEIVYYEFNPFLDLTTKTFDFEDIATNAILNVNYFGIKKLDFSFLQNCIIIDDVTHHLEDSCTSSADYCFGSLRKELPLPCGGFLTSPKKRHIPEGCYSHKAEQVSIQKLTAMFLKEEYLEGNTSDKDAYRKHFIAAEKLFKSRFTNAKIPETARAILQTLNVRTLLQKKKENVLSMLELLKEKRGFRYNFDLKRGEVFGLIIECPSNVIQTKFKSYLVRFKIFPAVLWPHQILSCDKEVAARILFIHLDYRYDLDAIKFISEIINNFSENE